MAELQSEQTARQDGRWQEMGLVNANDMLRKKNIAIVGSDQLAVTIATAAVALGVGGVEIIDNKKITDTLKNGFFYLDAYLGENRTESLEKTLKKLHPTIKDGIFGLHIDFRCAGSERLLNRPNVIIDATNDPASKKKCLTYAKEKRIPFISASSSQTESTALIYPFSQGTLEEKLLLQYYEGQDQGDVTSGFAAGFVVEELRKIILPLPKEKDIVKNSRIDGLHYNLKSSKRFRTEIDRNYSAIGDCGDKRVLIVGAGALGTWACTWLATMGVGEIHIVDDDFVERTNLNRQVLYYDSISKDKVNELCKQIKKINKYVKTTAYFQKINREFDINRVNPHLILGCVDNPAARKIINYFFLKYKIPVIDGGTSCTSGQIYTCIPDSTPCLECQIGELKEETARASCIANTHDNSVVMSNLITASLMAGEAQFILGKHAQPLAGRIKFDTYSPDRMSLDINNSMCTRDCKKEYGI